MNPTHEPTNTTPQPRAFGENFLADLVTDEDRFRAWLASATSTAVRPVSVPDASEPGSGCPEGLPASVFESDAWFEAARETYAQDELDQDRIPTSDGFTPWYRGQLVELFAHPGDLPMWVRSVLRESPNGYLLTEQGPRELDEAAAGEALGTAGQVLRSAARYLERHGWIQGAYYDATSQAFTPAACLVGAIGMVCYGGPVDAPAQHFADPGYLDFEEAVLHLDRYLLVEDGSESYEFNDAKGRRLADVLRVLRQAADTPAGELIDAIRVIDTRNADVAALAQLLTPGGVGGANPPVEQPDDGFEPNLADCLLCGAPGGYPYCQGSFGGQMSCADVVAADDAELAAGDGDVR